MSKPRKIAVVEPYFKSMGEHSYTRPDHATSFRVNYQWLKYGDENKKLAINKFSVFPENYYFLMNASVLYNNKEYKGNSFILTEPSDNMQTILDKVFNSINKQLMENIKVDHPNFNDENILRCWFEKNTILALSKYKAVLLFLPSDLKILNQKELDSTLRKEIPAFEGEDKNIIELFHNVWDRERLFLHASFSTAYKQYVCEMNESFIFLNKEFVCDSHLFDIWFSVDGENPFPIYNENYLFELAFMHGKQKFNKH